MEWDLPIYKHVQQGFFFSFFSYSFLFCILFQSIWIFLQLIYASFKSVYMLWMNYDILLSWLAEAEKKLQLLSQCLKVYFSTKKIGVFHCFFQFWGKFTIVEYIFTICKYVYHAKIKYTQKQRICICQWECTSVKMFQNTEMFHDFR